MQNLTGNWLSTEIVTDEEGKNTEVLQEARRIEDLAGKVEAICEEKQDNLNAISITSGGGRGHVADYSFITNSNYSPRFRDQTGYTHYLPSFQSSRL
jgi:hypothetical protein